MAADDGDSPLQNVPPRNAQNGHHQVLCLLLGCLQNTNLFSSFGFCLKESLKITQYFAQTLFGIIFLKLFLDFGGEKTREAKNKLLELCYTITFYR